MLTKHQKNILGKSLEILKDSNRLLIKGAAGTGKTFLVDELVRKLGLETYCTAPTNKAVAVLKSKVKSKVSFLTTHSALKLKRIIDNKTGQVFFKPSYNSKYPPLKDIGLFVVDESSMISSDMLLHIEKQATKQNTKVVFLGDNSQINPVGESGSPVFNRNYPEAELTEIIRQKEKSPVIDLSRNLELIKSKIPVTSECGSYIFSDNKEKIIDNLAAVNGTDELKYLAYTNKEVDHINLKVREKIYGTPAKIEEGETLVFNAPFGESYFTNEEVLVHRVIIRSKEFDYLTASDKKYSKSLKYYSINYQIVFPKITDNIIVVHEDSEKDFEDICSLLKGKAKKGDVPWAEYFRFYEQFADLKYNHALTIHKSQGSTYRQVIINIRDVNFCKEEKEKERLLYTAVTRASELVVLYKT